MEVETYFDGTDIRVSVPFAKKEEVKELGARFKDEDKTWALPPTSLNLLRLVELYGDGVLKGLPADVKSLVLEDWGFWGFTDEERERAEAHPEWETLFPFQREGVEYLYCNPHAAGLIGLSWGLGKGATATVAADLLGHRKVLVLAPLTLGPAWEGEHRRWTEEPGPFKRATASDPEPGEGWTVTNHETIQELVLRDEDGNVIQPDWVKNARKVKAWIQEGPTKVNKKGKVEPVRERITRVRRSYLETDWDLIIVDESVLLKNRKAVKADVLESLRKAGEPYVWELSASPTTKYRNDLYKQLKILSPRSFSSYWRFTEFFCIVDKGGWGWTIEGDRSDRDPRHYLRDFIWMKSEEEAGVELPEYHEPALEVEAGPRQREALDSMIEEWIVDLEEADHPVVADTWLARSTRIQQITSNLGALPKPEGGFHKPESAKADALVDLIKQGELQMPLLAWTWYIESTKLLAERLEKIGLDVVYVTGDLSSNAKDAALRSFKEGSVDALVCQMGVGKFGHTFTKTQSIYYHDRSFDSDAYLQSRRRVRRLGLEHEPTLLVPKIRNSADDLIDANLSGKMRSVADLTNMDLAELLRSIRED